MGNIARQREIIDRRALLDQLSLAAQSMRPGLDRSAFVAPLKAALAMGRAEIRRRFEATGDGAATVREQCFLMDQLIRTLFDLVTQAIYPLPNPTSGERLAIIAVGGYGRGELAPYSDIDLLLLFPYKRTPHTEQVVEYLLYLLWDLGLKIGQSTRSVEECLRHAKSDLTIRTALLEARYLWGDQALFHELKRRFDSEIVKGTAAQFVAAKLAERDERHKRVGDSRYQLEPNIKEGKGGLRDLHTLFWIAKYIYRTDDVGKLVGLGVLSAEESQHFSRAQSFLWTVRCHLHYLAGRAEERLTFDLQTEIGRRMGYTDHEGNRGVERFMKHYFLVAKDVGDLTRIFCAILEADQKHKRRLSWVRWGNARRALSGFIVDGERLTIPSEDFFKEDPPALLRLFQVAQQNELDIHPRALRAASQSLKLVNQQLRGDPEANRLFLEILTSRKDPETALRRMNEAGVFGRFIPDFGRVVAQMQYDMYHVYTVDEHTLFAIGILHKIESGLLKEELPLATQLMPTIVSRRALYLAVLLHDIAKGRGGDHSEIGEQIALKLGPRLGLSAEETETVAWLVRWHLLMSSTAFKLDIGDAQTIANFVERVQSPERLKLLLVLTVADIRAVGPKVWNGWKAALLRELYHRAIEVISGGLSAEGQDSHVAAAQAAVRRLLPDFSDAQFATFAGRGYAFYWLSFDAATHARHARLMREAEASSAPLTVEKRIDPHRAVTEITLYTADHPGLFSRIAGALAVSGANIVDARIVTMSNGMALDTFWVQDSSGGAFDRPEKLAKLAVVFENVLTGDLKPHRELARLPTFSNRTRVFTVTPRVLVDNKISDSHTVIEVNGRDRPGLLFELTRALTGLNVQVSSAKISTYGEKVVDVFYVKNLFGHKVEHPAKLAEIQRTLEGVLAKGNEPASAMVTREQAAAE
ncbi:MAG: [protein-PII] uridylyltransferase [Alphaproteobacteria bacterium]|nr:[protein-PII] uridylyltransferase [Alphaproteobacteria bacterium]MBV9815697.1 [protein-PII] uridylyltransferase [Alphaproteobacteria bacterium]